MTDPAFAIVTDVGQYEFFRHCDIAPLCTGNWSMSHFLDKDLSLNVVALLLNDLNEDSGRSRVRHLFCRFGDIAKGPFFASEREDRLWSLIARTAHSLSCSILVYVFCFFTIDVHSLLAKQ